MPSPAELRAQAADLRDCARTLRAKAPLLDDDTAGVLSHYPHHGEGVWWGTAATQFYTMVEDARRTFGEVTTDVLGYAGRCDSKARELEDEADEIERQLSLG